MNDRQTQTDLSGAWHQLCRAFTQNDPLAQQILQELTAYYEADGRYYHTMTHVLEVLQHIRHGYPVPDQPPATLLFAAWFHDVIYEPSRQDNEARSADFAAARLGQLGVAEAQIARVQDLILVTATHQPPAQDRAARILIDADLAILGALPDDYDRYARAIRREYHFVPEAAYKQGRRQVLQAFLERSSIFLTDPFAARERQARHNLQREITRLQ